MDQAITLSEQVFRQVLSASWHAAVLALVALIVCATCGRWLPARWRFAIWLLVLLRLALPLAPSSDFSMFNWMPSSNTQISAAQFAGAPAPRSQIHSPFSNHSPVASATVEVDMNSTESAPLDAVGSARPEPVTAAQPTGFQWWRGAAVVWACGVGLLLVRQVWLAVCLTRRRRLWSEAAAPALRALLDDCRAETGVRRTVPLLFAPTAVGPASTGILRPRIVLPQSMLEQLTDDELRLVLLHELMHVRRRDVLIDSLAYLIVAVHWLNPFAWLALRRLRAERELACDQAVLDRVGARHSRRYGNVVLKVVEHFVHGPAVPGLVGFGQGALLRRRIQMIADYRKRSRVGSSVGCALLAALVVGGLTNARAQVDDVATPAAQDPQASQPTEASAAEPAQSVKTLTINGGCSDGEKPISGATVALYRYDSANLERTKLIEVRTDDRGRFSFLDMPLPPTRDANQPSVLHGIVAIASGQASAISLIQADDLPVVGRQLDMPQAAALRGRVIDAQGNPVAGAMVWTSGLFSEPLEGVMSARTDRDGRYEIADLRPWDADKIELKPMGNGMFSRISECYFDVRHPNYATARPAYKRIPDEINVVLQPAGNIEGQVVDRVTGLPAAGVVVSMQGDRSTSHHWQQTRTDDLGWYRLSSLAAGKYNIWAQMPDRTCVAIESLEVAASQRVEAPEIKLVEGGWLEGRVIVAATGQPMPWDERGQELQIGLYGPSRPKSGAAVQSAPVDENGGFRIRVAPGKNYPYIMSSDVWRRTQLREFFEAGIDVAAGEIASVEFRILPTEPPRPPQPSVVRLPVPVPDEQDAAAAIRNLGGWYQVDDDGHVVEVNMVYHYTAEGVRYNNPRGNTDAALAHVIFFPRLNRLFLKEGQASDESVKQLARLTELEKFFVWDATRLTDAGVRQLAVHRKLHDIHISNAGLTDDSLETFSQMPEIERLSLQGNAFTDVGLAYLRDMKQLRSLVVGLGDSKFTDDGIEHLLGLENLEVLGLQHSTISETAKAKLKKLPKLRRVYGEDLTLNPIDN